MSLVGKRLQLGAAAAPFWLSDFNLTYEHSGNDNIFTGEAGFGGPFSPIVRPKVTIVNGQLADRLGGRPAQRAAAAARGARVRPRSSDSR